MEIISYEPQDFSDKAVLVASLDGMEVFIEQSGQAFLRKPNGYIYILNDAEAANPEAFLSKVQEYNL